MAISLGAYLNFRDTLCAVEFEVGEKGRIKLREHYSHESAIEAVRAELALGRRAIYRPPPRMSVPDWADEFRRLSASVGAVGGKWQTRRVEVARGPLMSVTEPGVNTITAMTCTQLLKTELMLNTIGYFAHLDPAPMLLLEPKDEMATAFSKERIVPMITHSPELAKLMGGGKSRDSDDTIGFKKFPGGFLVMSSAGSPTNMAMRAIRITLLDEIDKYEPTKEGDPVVLAEERTSTFVHSDLHIRACSPTWTETSRIYRSYQASDQRRGYVACPHCGHEQTLDFFRHVNWEKDGEDGIHKPETAAIYCEACGSAWSEAERVKLMTTKYAIRHYQTKQFVCCDERQDPRDRYRELWESGTPDEEAVAEVWDWDDEHQIGYAKCKHCGERAVSNRHAGFTASKLYSPFTSVVALAEKWLEAKGDPETKQTFYNTQLGEPYHADVTKEVSSHWLAQRREVYPANPVELPEGVVALTCGVDVQAGGQANQGRLECEVVGWGIGEESWSIDVPIFIGDPEKPELWQQLDDFLKRTFRHERGFDLPILATCIDSGGHNTNAVYKFARARVGRNVWAIKGASDRGGQWSPIWPALEKEKKRKRYRTGYKPVIIGVNSAKESIRQKLLVEDAGPSYCHFPLGREEAWFEQLTSENLVVERKAGVMVRRWDKKKGIANEALDARVYAYAALVGLYHVRRVNLERIASRLEQYRRGAVSAEISAPQKRRARPKARRSSFMDG